MFRSKTENIAIDELKSAARFNWAIENLYAETEIERSLYKLWLNVEYKVTEFELSDTSEIKDSHPWSVKSKTPWIIFLCRFAEKIKKILVPNFLIF